MSLASQVHTYYPVPEQSSPYPLQARLMSPPALWAYMYYPLPECRSSPLVFLVLPSPAPYPWPLFLTSWVLLYRLLRLRVFPPHHGPHRPLHPQASLCLAPYLPLFPAPLHLMSPWLALRLMSPELVPQPTYLGQPARLPQLPGWRALHLRYLHHSPQVLPWP